LVVLAKGEFDMDAPIPAPRNREAMDSSTWPLSSRNAIHSQAPCRTTETDENSMNLQDGEDHGICRINPVRTLGFDLWRGSREGLWFVHRREIILPHEQANCVARREAQ
jgi:hypothetical protein